METTAKDNVIPMGTVSVAEVATETPAQTEEEIKATKEDDNKSVYVGIVGAVTKLQEELKKAKNTEFANPIISHLIERCKDSESLSNDVCQDHKTWDKCFDYIYSQARKQTKGNCAAVRDDVVYEWAEDYYHKDDKKEEEEKAKKAAEKKKKDAEKKAKEAAVKEDKTRKKDESVQESKTEIKKEEKPKPEPKQKAKKNDADGQMDIFSFMAGIGGD